jgi:hypothetical protein
MRHLPAIEGGHGPIDAEVAGKMRRVTGEGA